MEVSQNKMQLLLTKKERKETLSRQKQYSLHLLVLPILICSLGLKYSKKSLYFWWDLGNVIFMKAPLNDNNLR